MNWDDDLIGGDISEEQTIAWNREQHKQTREALEARAKAGMPDDPLDSLSTEEIRQLAERSAAAQAEKDKGQRQYAAARTFSAEEPQFISNPTNNSRIVAYLQARGLSGENVDDFHEAFSKLNAAGLLKVNPTKPQPRPTVDLNKLSEHAETLSYEDLRAAANAELRREPGKVRIVGQR